MPDMTMLVIGGGVLGVLLILAALFSGPSAGKASNRRLETVRERHSRSSEIAAQAQLKKIMANRRNATKVDVVLPFDPKTAAAAAKLGQPLAKLAKSSKLAQALNQLLNLTLEQAEANEGAEEKGGEKPSLLSKLGSFASLGKKKESAKVALAK